jgi:hypothetical protein
LYTPLSGSRSGFRNEIINGNFQINQRGYTSGSNLASGSYGFDRWKSTFTNTTLTFTSAPQGQMVTINSGGSIEQVIERENIVAGTHILSWTGTATARIYNTGATPPSYAVSPITVTLDGTANVEVEFIASGGTRTLQNVQLEQGTVASAFEQRPIGTELVLCQRYYEQMPPSIGGLSSGYVFLTVPNSALSTLQIGTWTYKVSKRALPIVGLVPGTSLTNALDNPGIGSVTPTAITLDVIGTDNCRVYTTTSSGYSVGQGFGYKNGNLFANAEL